MERVTEAARSEHFAASDAVHAAQNEMFAANAEVARLESELQHLSEGRQRLDARLSQLAAEREHWQTQLATSERDELRWQDLLANARERLARSQSRHEEAAQRLPQAEQALRDAEAASAALRRELGQAEQQLRVEEAHRTSAMRALEALAQRHTRLTQDRKRCRHPMPLLCWLPKKPTPRSIHKQTNVKPQWPRCRHAFQSSNRPIAGPSRPIAPRRNGSWSCAHGTPHWCSCRKRFSTTVSWATG
jgi:small-conductance mechanosensitive channel